MFIETLDTLKECKFKADKKALVIIKSWSHTDDRQ